MGDRQCVLERNGEPAVLEAPANALTPLCGALPAGWQDVPLAPQLTVPASAGDASNSCTSSSSGGCMLGAQGPGCSLSLDTLAVALSESLLPSALLAHMSASDDNTNSSSSRSSSGSSHSSGSAVPGEATVGGVRFEKCPLLPPQFAPQLQSAWAPAADPVLAYGTGHPASSTAQLQLQQPNQQQQQKSESKGRARRQRQQQEEDVPQQYATSTVFFAGVSPIATEAGLLSVFEQFGTVIRVNLFRPYRTCKTSKGCGLVVFSKPSEAANAMETLSGRFVWPGARSPIIMEWGNCSRPQQQQQQQAVARPPQPAAAAAGGGLSGKAATRLSPQRHLMPAAGSLVSHTLLHPVSGRAGQLVPPALMQQPQQYQPLFQQQQQQQQQTVLLIPQGVSLPPGFAPGIVAAGGTAGQLLVLARY